MVQATPTCCGDLGSSMSATAEAVAFDLPNCPPRASLAKQIKSHISDLHGLPALIKKLAAEEGFGDLKS